MSSRAEYLLGILPRMLGLLCSIVVLTAMLFWTMRYCRHSCRREDAVDKKRSMLRKLLLLENPGDGLFACPGVRPKIKSAISAFIITFALAPLCLLSLFYLWARLVSFAGSWKFVEAFWIVVFALGFTPTVFYPNAVSTSTSEDIKLLACGVLAVIQFNVVLTLVSMLKLIDYQIRSFREGPLFILCLLCLILPLVFFVVCCLGGVLLMLREGISFTEAFFFHLNWTISGGNWPIYTQTEPASTDVGAMVQIYVGCMALPITGIVIGFIGGLPGMGQLMYFLEGATITESSDMQEVVGSREEELMARIDEDEKTIQELRHKLRQAEEAGSQAKRQNTLLLAHLGMEDFAEAQQQLFDKQKFQSDSLECRDGVIIKDHSNEEPVAKSPDLGIQRANKSVKRAVHILCHIGGAGRAKSRQGRKGRASRAR